MSRSLLAGDSTKNNRHSTNGSCVPSPGSTESQTVPVLHLHQNRDTPCFPASISPRRRSGIFLRHSFIVAPLLSLNGNSGMSFLCRLSLNWCLLFLIVPNLRKAGATYDPVFAAPVVQSLNRPIRLTFHSIVSSANRMPSTARSHPSDHKHIITSHGMPAHAGSSVCHDKTASLWRTMTIVSGCWRTATTETVE